VVLDTPPSRNALEFLEAPRKLSLFLDEKIIGVFLPSGMGSGGLFWRNARQLESLRDGASAWACGIVVMRQQPETAKGTIFVTLEDETGSVNVIVWRSVREAQRQALLASRLLAVGGQWQRSPEGVMHLIARELRDVTHWLGRLGTQSRDFH